VTQGSWTDFISVAAIVIVALSPLLRRIYIARFWIHVRSQHLDHFLRGNTTLRHPGKTRGLLKVRADQ